jgi:carbamoyl-phosphate synthase large subunit
MPHVAVKEAVLPFSRFSGVDIILGPEMKSTGEVMGIDSSFGSAFYKAEAGAGQTLPLAGKVFLSVKNSDKRNIVFIAKKLYDMNFSIIATNGTWKVLASNNINAEKVDKIAEGSNRIPELIKGEKIKLIINTPSGKKGQFDMKKMRRLAVRYGIPCITTISGAQAAVNGIETTLKKQLEVKSLQKYLAQ